jgi:hypothetical protein
MYSGEYARTRADQPAFIMAQTCETITHAELEARSNRLAHFLRSVSLDPPHSRWRVEPADVPGRLPT